MRIRAAAVAVVVLAAVAVDAGAIIRLKPDTRRAQRQEVLVSVATSLADVMQTIAGAYRSAPASAWS